MQWIAPSEKDAASGSLEKRLWDAADQFQANFGVLTTAYDDLNQQIQNLRQTLGLLLPRLLSGQVKLKT